MIGRHRVQRLIFLAALVGASFPAMALAQSRTDSAVAQGLFDDGRRLMASGNYAEACPKLEESQRLDPGSGTLLNLGICYERQGRLASAWTTLLEAATSAKATGNANRETSARQRAAAVSGRVGRMTIRVKGTTPGLEIMRDGAAVRAAQWGTPIPSDAGVHAIVVTAPGRKTWETKITLRDGANETVTVPELSVASDAVVKPQKPEGSTTAAIAPHTSEVTSDRPGNSLGTQRVLALGAGGIGVAGLVVGSVFAMQSKSARDDARTEQHCQSDGGCPTEDGAALVDKAWRAGNVATAGFAVGAVGIVAGAILWWTAPQGPQIGVGMGSLQLKGTW